MVAVNWTAVAIQDLQDIGMYIARDSDLRAKQIVSELFNSVDILEKQPNVGSIVREFNNATIRQILVYNFRVVYHRVSEYRIDILAVRHSAQQLGSVSSIQK